MKTVAVVNQKGGVGKTATVLGLASAAAQEPSRRILIVDLDPQANATVGLGVEGGEFTTGDVLFADAKGVAADAITKTAWGDGVSCIPANLALAERDADVSLGSEFRLRKALAGVEGFDLVLIDCPPSIGRLVTNGLVAADHALVVTQAAAPSLMGVANVMATVDVVSEHYNPGLAVAGIVVNLLPPRQREADYRLAELVEAFGTTVWEPYVPARAVVSEGRVRGSGCERSDPRLRQPGPRRGSGLRGSCCSGHGTRDWVVSDPARKPVLAKAPVRDHPVAPTAPSPGFDAQPHSPDRTAMLSARVDADLRQAVKRHAVEHAMSVQQIVDEAIRAYLAQHS